MINNLYNWSNLTKEYNNSDYTTPEEFLKVEGYTDTESKYIQNRIKNWNKQREVYKLAKSKVEELEKSKQLNKYLTKLSTSPFLKDEFKKFIEPMSDLQKRVVTAEAVKPSDVVLFYNPEHINKMSKIVDSSLKPPTEI